MFRIRFDNAYITWINDGKQAWSLMGPGMGADARTEIHARPVPQEPMVRSLISSQNFPREAHALAPVSYRQFRILAELWLH